MFGGQTASLPINTAEGAVLPNSIRQFQIDWGTAVTNKGFFGQVAAEWQHFALGSYTAQANITYGTSGQTLSASATLMMFPWHLLLVELVGLVIVGLALVFGIKNYNGMIIRRAEGQLGQRPRR